VAGFHSYNVALIIWFHASVCVRRENGSNGRFLIELN